ncbi:MAG: hypothetical protein J6V09_02765 [Clostridia bacterium]|nr:hypothetical protein [Clostridia bacterium]
MNKSSETTRSLLIKHYQAYPKLQIEDVFKYLFQSALGCEHLLTDENAALGYIKREYESVSKTDAPLVDALDGNFSRVHLSTLNCGLTAETLAKTFFLSASPVSDGKKALEEKLALAGELIGEGSLPLDAKLFDSMLEGWRDMGFPAVRHSDTFRKSYRPAYRVISNRFSEYLPLFSEIDKRLKNGPLVIAIEGGSASGKTTLAAILRDVYDCNVFHTDDFFLRPEQRTAERLSEVGGNIDRERLYDEVISPILKGEEICYRPFDCQTGELDEAVTVSAKGLTVIEGTYSMHPAFDKYYDLGIFLDISPELQKKRIINRNTPEFANRFFEEWIPLENEYFTKTDVKNRSLCLTIGK